MIHWAVRFRGRELSDFDRRSRATDKHDYRCHAGRLAGIEKEGQREWRERRIFLLVDLMTVLEAL
jgi:hypothetical protein